MSTIVDRDACGCVYRQVVRSATDVQGNAWWNQSWEQVHHCAEHQKEET